MSDNRRPLYALSVAEFIELTERIVRQVLEGTGSAETKTSAKPEDVTMTIDQLAVFLNCSKVSVHAYKKRGLPYYRVGRKILFRREEVLAFMSSQVKGKRKAMLISKAA